MIQVAGLDSPVYRFVNDDVAPKLTLVKVVVNNDGGTAVNTAWTLQANTPGGPNLSGATGAPAVTSQNVRAGAGYTLSESTIAGYELSSLVCTGYPGTTKASPTLTLKPGTTEAVEGVDPAARTCSSASATDETNCSWSPVGPSDAA